MLDTSVRLFKVFGVAAVAIMVSFSSFEALSKYNTIVFKNVRSDERYIIHLRQNGLQLLFNIWPIKNFLKQTILEAKL